MMSHANPARRTAAARPRLRALPVVARRAFTGPVLAGLVLAGLVLAGCGSPAPGPGTPDPTGPAGGTPTQPVGAGTVPVPPTATVTPVPEFTSTPYAGSIDQPLPLGDTAEWTAENGAVLRIQVTEAYRGWAARQAILAHGEPEAAAPDGFEWIYFRANVDYPGPDMGPVELEAGFWRAVSGDTTTTAADAPVCCLEPGFPINLAVGESRAAVMALLVRVDDAEPLIGAGAAPDGSGGIYFAVSEGALSATSVLFEDDFSAADGGWQAIYRDARGISDYDQGGFRLQVADPNYDAWANPGLEFTDVRLEVEATMLGGPDDNVFGLVCRYVDAANFYMFLVSSDGFYGVAKYTGGQFALVGSDLMLPSETILTGEATNRLRAECVGETLRLFANGEQITEVMDADHPSGDVGLIAGTFDEPGTDILFDHFAVLAP